MRREHSQSLRQRRARNSERRLKRLEAGGGKIAFAQYKKRPAIAQDRDGAANRAVTLADDAAPVSPVADARRAATASGAANSRPDSTATPYRRVVYALRLGFAAHLRARLLDFTTAYIV